MNLDTIFDKLLEDLKKNPKQMEEYVKKTKEDIIRYMADKNKNMYSDLMVCLTSKSLEK